MRNRQQNMVIITFVMLFLLVLSGCGRAEKTKNPEFPATYEHIPSQEVAANDLLSLEWDSEKACVLLTEKHTGKVWSTIPYDFYNGTETNEDMNSPIYIQYVDNASMLTVLDKGYTDCVSMGKVTSEQENDGIRITYYFEKAQIVVPVIYSLRDDALTVTVDFANVQEGENRLLSVSVAPFLCSTKNSEKEAYLVVPSGSGALMYTDERQEGVRTWTGEIYGADATRLVPEELTETEKVRLPFFGVKDGEYALLAIVEKGDEGAYLTANAGNDSNGHSNMYVSFYARGYDVSESQTAWALSDVYRTEETIQIQESTIAFYPLSEEDADYVGMAKRYQQYLKEKELLKETVSEEAYALYVTGGAQVKELTAGIPIQKTRALTTFKQALDIVDDLSQLTEHRPAVQMKGFGKTGLDAGIVGGGFEFANVFGTEKERQALENYCEEQKVPLYTDFDLVYFTKNGEGINTLLSPAKTASSRKMKIYPKDKALWHFDEDEKGMYLAGRKELPELTERLLKTVEKKKISGVSLGTLGKTAYSDYSDVRYSVRGNTVSDIQETIGKIEKQGIAVATEQANAYAAAVSNTVFSVPTDDGDFIDIDCSVPLYQMVFRGYVPLYSSAVNTTSNLKKSLAKAVACGTNLGFAVVGKYDDAFATTVHKDLNVCSYEENREKIAEFITNSADYFEVIKGQTLVDYEYISEEVSKTTFSNGVVVYTNHSAQTAASPLGELSAYEFTYTSEEN